jgi:hypothetical protein
VLYRFPVIRPPPASFNVMAPGEGGGIRAPGTVPSRGREREVAGRRDAREPAGAMRCHRSVLEPVPAGFPLEYPIDKFL